ncbi:hypothetical protein FQA39_LY15438 [Lamprigera yunnana]|nr:hypothetical protein FQA39_LY15438 [Lamprigera yunnana]
MTDVNRALVEVVGFKGLVSKQKQKLVIKSKDYTTPVEEKEIAGRWQQYVEYDDLEVFEELEREEGMISDELGPPILQSKFEKVLTELKSRKIYGVDNISASA